MQIYTICVAKVEFVFLFKDKTNFENLFFFIFEFQNKNWKMKEFFEIHFLISNQKMNSKILIFVF